MLERKGQKTDLPPATEKISGTFIDVTAKSTVIVNDVHTESIVWIVLSVVESAVELHVPTLLV